MSYPIEFDFLVIIDCWEIDTDDDIFPKNHFKKMYINLIESFSDFKFKDIIFANIFFPFNRKKPNQRFTDKLFYEYCKKSNRPIIEISELSNLYEIVRVKENTKILVGGKSWSHCIHKSNYGLINFYKNGFDVYTHPKLCYWKENNPVHVSENEIVNDEYLIWEKKDNGIYKVIDIIK